jgi:ABC-2 type transport system ATP-binding protein
LRAAHDTTIVLTTHYLDEADSMAERVIVVDHGRIIADDTPARLKAEHVGDTIVLGFDSGLETASAAALLVGRDLVAYGKEVKIRTQGGPRQVPGILEDLRSAGVPAASVEVVRPTLDDVFLKLTGRSLREGGASEPTRELVGV